MKKKPIILVTLKWFPTDIWGIDQLLEDTPRKAWADEICALVNEDLSTFLDECQWEVEVREVKRKG